MHTRVWVKLIRRIPVNSRMPTASPSLKGVFALVVLLAIVGVSCRGSATGGKGAGPSSGGLSEPRKIQLVEAKSELTGRSVVGYGTLAPDEQADASFKVAGRVSSLLVDLGSSVRKGQVIAKLDATDFEFRVKQAEAAFEQARARVGLAPTGGDQVDILSTGTVKQAKAVLDEASANLDRGKQLFKTGVIAKAQLDAYESAYRVAEAKYQDAVEEVRNRQAVLLQRKSELELTRQQLEDTELKAAFDGVVSEKKANVGEYLAVGAPVVTLVRRNPLRMRAEVPEREAAAIRQGQQVKVSIEGESDDAYGRVARLSPVINSQNRVLMAEIEVDNGRGILRAGAFARADIFTQESVPIVTIPETALVTFAGVEKVFLARDGKAIEKVVTTGKRENGRIEITSGLSAGDMVVAEPGNLVAGQAVIFQ